MQKPIVVPLDGSPLAEHALIPAVALAKKLGARLHLLRVQEVESPSFPYLLPLAFSGTRAERTPDVVSAGQAYLNAVAPRLQDELAGCIDVIEVEGNPAKTIVDYARRVGAISIVMATRRHDGLQRTILSSVTDDVVRRAGVPVLVVGPETTPMQRSEEWNCERLLIPIDGSRLSRKIIYPATQIALGTGARITFLRVLPVTRVLPGYPAAPFGGAYEQTFSPREAAAGLEELAQVLRSSGVSVDTRVVQTALNTADAIMNEALDANADMIALATRGHGIAKRFAFGSVAHELVKRSELPLLLLSPLEKHEAAAAFDSDHDALEVRHA